MDEHARPNPPLAHRMGRIVVKATPGAPVAVDQLEHAFWFGTAVADQLAPLTAGPLDTPQSAACVAATGISLADREQYLAVLRENFNSAVHENAMKWYTTERRHGEVSYATADAWLAWCQANGLRMRGHCVYWEVEQFVQDWVKQLDDQALRTALEARASELLTRYKGAIAAFDVNNEMVHGAFYSRRLGESIWRDMFDWCRRANPDAVLYVNDFGILSGDDLPRYERQIEMLLAQGAPVGGIGLQGHFHDRVDRDKVTRVLDRLARFGLPITITEFDMKTLDEDAKARGLETLYRTCFEHPAVDGLLMWGFWAGAHWLASRNWGIDGYTALWDRDWKPMPAARVYRKLVFDEWWTRLQGTVDATGVCAIPVFLGKHRVTVAGAEMVAEVRIAGDTVLLATE